MKRAKVSFILGTSIKVISVSYLFECANVTRCFHIYRGIYFPFSSIVLLMRNWFSLEVKITYIWCQCLVYLDAFVPKSSVAHYYITICLMVYTSFNSFTLLASMQLIHIWTSLRHTLVFMTAMEVCIRSLCFQ